MSTIHFYGRTPIDPEVKANYLDLIERALTGGQLEPYEWWIFAFSVLAAVILLALAIRIIWPRKYPWEFTARVSWVCDGDSVWVKNWFCRRKLRLAGIDAPESEQEYGRDSTETLGRLIDCQKVRIRVIDRDIYGRYVAFITRLDGLDVNLQMVREGAAWPYFSFLRSMPPNVANPILSAYRYAKARRIGLWYDPAAEAPWNWRRRHRSLWARFVLWLKRLCGVIP